MAEALLFGEDKLSTNRYTSVTATRRKHSDSLQLVQRFNQLPT